MQTKTVLITGAATGFGREATLALAERGVLSLASRLERARRNASGDCAGYSGLRFFGWADIGHYPQLEAPERLLAAYFAFRQARRVRM